MIDVRVAGLPRYVTVMGERGCAVSHTSVLPRSNVVGVSDAPLLSTRHVTVKVTVVSQGPPRTTDTTALPEVPLLYRMDKR